ncbi:hypothetical protein NUW58_g8983 [Xylaria curta]|uniref:Uncharacterized protein n=1 Tax=Xylaria curta TaxID=42375 RepID=A0ACC1N1V7_9PEZI|nr:hypothetical protein NUW58_g8983 [Xylaria curta]
MAPHSTSLTVAAAISILASGWAAGMGTGLSVFGIPTILNGGGSSEVMVRQWRFQFLRGRALMPAIGMLNAINYWNIAYRCWERGLEWRGFASQTPSLLTIVIDINPRAWAAIHDLLPISKAIANILVFINAHLAYGNENQVAVLAAHTNRAVWLYPTSPNPDSLARHRRHASSRDVDMAGVDGHRLREPSSARRPTNTPSSPRLESSILASLRSLIDATGPSDLSPTTLISGALSMALAYIHKTSLAFEPPKTSG